MSSPNSPQPNVLRRVLKANSGCSLSAYHGIAKLHAYRDFELLYQSFTRAVPIQGPKAWGEQLGKMVQPPGQPLPQVLQSSNLVSRGRPVAVVPWRGQAIPLGRTCVDDFLKSEGAVRDQLKAQGIALKGAFFYLTEAEPLKRTGLVPVMGFSTAVDGGRNWFRKRWTLPRHAEMAESFGTRLQGFAAMLDQLRQHGRNIGVLVAHPKTLIDFALYVSQQESRFVPLRELLPNLQVFAFTGYDISLQRTELGYVLGGLPNLKWMQWCFSPTGFDAWQDDVNIRQRLRVLDDGQTFYEFIPVEDIYPDGRFIRNYRRFHAGKVEIGKEYLLAVSSQSGLLGISTGQVVKVLASAPLTVALRGPIVRLNGLGEAFREDGVLEALANINMALVQHGVFVRDAFFGHRVAERVPVWLLELSRPLPEVTPALMESIAKRLHSEMDLRFSNYRSQMRGGGLKPPQVHFVPMGSFAASQTLQADFGHFDHSPDGALIKRVLGVAWQSKMVEGC